MEEVLVVLFNQLSLICDKPPASWTFEILADKCHRVIGRMGVDFFEWPWRHKPIPTKIHCRGCKSSSFRPEERSNRGWNCLGWFKQKDVCLLQKFSAIHLLDFYTLGAEGQINTFHTLQKEHEYERRCPRSIVLFDFRAINQDKSGNQVF